MRGSLVELCDMAEQARVYADALTHARKLLALKPLSEDADWRVMRPHYFAGVRAAGLLAFERCEQVLKAEIGARPSTLTLALQSGPCTLRPATVRRRVALLEPCAVSLAALEDLDLQFEFEMAHGFALDDADRLRDAITACDSALALPRTGARPDLLWQAMGGNAATLSKMRQVVLSAHIGE